MTSEKEKLLMTKNRVIWIFILAILAVVLFLQGDQIARKLRTILPDTLQEAGPGSLKGDLADKSADNSSNSAADNAAGQNNGHDVGQDDKHSEETGEGQSKDTSAAAIVAEGEADASLINEMGTTVCERILVPEGFERVAAEEGSFGEYLRNLPLKPHGSQVTYYNGDKKPLDVHVAVLDIDVGSRDLQQCADSVIRLRAEYLYGKGLFDRIHFNFTNGFRADYAKWSQGYRIKVTGNKAEWVKQDSRGTDYASFRKYLDMVFSYAGTLSLSKEMKNIPVEKMQPGDVFLKGASPGHCVIVMDMARDEKTGEMRFIIAQGYMPAQEMHILKNPANAQGNPWYSLNFGDQLVTPEWTFTRDQLFRFED